MNTFLSDISLLFERLDWLGVLDLLLVTGIFFLILKMVSDTRAVIILRGMVLLIILLSILTSVVNLPAFNYLIKSALPALLLAIPVIFAPEIRKGLERIGQAGQIFTIRGPVNEKAMKMTIGAVVSAASRLANRKHGALIVLQRSDILDEFIQTGVVLNAVVTPEILLQVFYPNTPLHDGAVIITGDLVAAGACVMPLSASGILNRTPDRQMGLRHRAALGISEVSDAIAVVVSEETGSIAVSHAGRMIRRLDADRLENILTAFYRPERLSARQPNWLIRLASRLRQPKEDA